MATVGLEEDLMRCVLPALHSTTDDGGSPIQVGFVTYDKSLHFYNIKVSVRERE